MEETADLTVIQKMNNDTLHKQGEPQVIAEGAECLEKAILKHIYEKIQVFKGKV